MEEAAEGDDDRYEERAGLLSELNGIRDGGDGENKP